MPKRYQIPVIVGHTEYYYVDADSPEEAYETAKLRLESNDATDDVLDDSEGCFLGDLDEVDEI